MNTRYKYVIRFIKEHNLQGIIFNDYLSGMYLLEIYRSVNPGEIRLNLLVTENSVVLITDKLSLRRIEREIPPWVQVVIGDGDKFMRSGKGCFREVRREIQKQSIRKIGVFKELSCEFVPAHVKLIMLKENPLAKLAEIKTEYEVEMLKKANAISDKVYAQIANELQTNVSEIRLKARIDELLFAFGSDHNQGGALVSFGENTNAIHAVSTNRKLKKGDLVMLDFAAYVKGIGSDITRTFVIGKANHNQKKMWHTVYHAQKKALNAIRPKISGKAIDQVARDYIKAAGYGDYFFHTLGHQLGLMRGNTKLYCGENKPLYPGMALTVEPGIYTENGGVRIEDDILVTKDGMINLTNSSKEMELG